MDRNKPSSSRSGKSKIGAPHHGSEIFALGSKSSSTSSNRDDVKSKVMSSSTSSSKSSTDRKREASTSLVSGTAKKPKLPSLGGSGSGGTSSSSVSGSVSHSSRIGETSTGTASTQQEYWEQVAQDCDASELVQSVLAAIDRQDSNQVRQIRNSNFANLANFCFYLVQNRWWPYCVEQSRRSPIVQNWNQFYRCPCSTWPNSDRAYFAMKS